jgi:hypothetical protein
MAGEASRSADLHADWETRELVEVVQLSMLKVCPSSSSFVCFGKGGVDARPDGCPSGVVRAMQIVQSLNKLDSAARSKLSKIHERISSLERCVQQCESALVASKEAPEDDEA